MMDAAKSVTADFQRANLGLHVGRTSGPSSGDAIITATVTARAGCGSIDHIQFGSLGETLDNTLVTITSSPRGPSTQSTGFTYTPAPGTMSVTFVLQRATASGGVLVDPIVVYQAAECGAWRTFVGAGSDAFR
jgi:hypothetical protein